MNLLLGVGFLAAAIIMFMWAFASTRRPDPPRWVRHESVTGGLALVFTMLLPLGPGFLIAGIADLDSQLKELGFSGIALLIAMTWGALWTMRSLRRRTVGGELLPRFDPAKNANPA